MNTESELRARWKCSQKFNSTAMLSKIINFVKSRNPTLPSLMNYLLISEEWDTSSFDAFSSIMSTSSLKKLLTTPLLSNRVLKPTQESRPAISD